MPLVYSSLYSALREANVSPDLAAEAAAASNFSGNQCILIERKLAICLALTGANALLSFATLLALSCMATS